jgi:hypothetical protein
MDLDSTPELSPEAVNLQFEADAAIAGAEPEALTDTGLPPPAPVDAAEEFRKALKMPMLLNQRVLMAQWNINDELRDELTEATAECLAQLFPDGMGGQYACWFRLLGCSGIIVVGGMASNGGKFPGFGPKRDPDPTPENGFAQAA